MSDLQISSIDRLKRQLELQKKPFPVWALLILYENGSSRDLYCNYFEGFKLLVEWLGPIELTPHSEPLNRLHRTYELQELSVILKTTQENLNHGYQTCLSIIQLASNFTLMPAQIPTYAAECTREFQ